MWGEDGLVAVVDLEDVRRYRSGMQSRAVQSAHLSPTLHVPSISVDFTLSSLVLSEVSSSSVSTHSSNTSLLAQLTSLKPTPPQPVRYHTPEEEIAYGTLPLPLPLPLPLFLICTRRD